MKKCSTCGVWKPSSKYPIDRQKSDGLRGQCKICRSADQRRFREKGGKRFLAKQREVMARYRERHPERVLQQRREAYQRNHEKELHYATQWNSRSESKRQMRNSYTKRKFGLTVDEYDKLYAKLMHQQDGKCAACGGVPQKRLEMDHCHAKGHVRALLCGHCNRALGLLHENPVWMRKLAEYAENYC